MLVVAVLAFLAISCGPKLAGSFMQSVAILIFAFASYVFLTYLFTFGISTKLVFQLLAFGR